MTSLKAALGLLLLLPVLTLARTPTSQPAPSAEPTVKQGLSVALTLSKATFVAEEPVAFAIQFKNVSTKPLSLRDAEHFWSWKLSFWDTRTGDTWLLHKLFFEDKKRSIPVTTLNPGQTLDVPIVLDARVESFEYKWEGAEVDRLKVRQHLPPGQYRLTIGVRLVGNPGGVAPSSYWAGSIAPKPVEFQITAK